MRKASAYKVMPDPIKGEHSWLVQHTKRSEKIVWGQHQFEVTVNQDSGEFTCECKTWEHTGTKLLPFPKFNFVSLKVYMFLKGS